jgi:hypothetical protein
MACTLSGITCNVFVIAWKHRKQCWEKQNTVCPWQLVSKHAKRPWLMWTTIFVMYYITRKWIATSFKLVQVYTAIGICIRSVSYLTYPISAFCSKKCYTYLKYLRRLGIRYEVFFESTLVRTEVFWNLSLIIKAHNFRHHICIWAYTMTRFAKGIWRPVLAVFILACIIRQVMKLIYFCSNFCGIRIHFPVNVIFDKKTIEWC